ncbi:MAG: hypothetical protein Q9168_001609 [Polycauliona sp. 1 TL-2023]
MVLYAASRKGHDLGITPASSNTTLKYPKLDIADRSSIDSFAQMIQKDHANLDVLINNAGVNLDPQYSPANAKTTLDINYQGTLNMCQTFIPLLKKNGRIVNVSSAGSSLNGYSSKIQQRFRDPNMTLPDLHQMMKEYQNSANNKTESRDGWKSQAYGVTKAAINAMTGYGHGKFDRPLAQNAWYVILDKCSEEIVRLLRIVPADGAAIPVRLGFEDIGDVTGRYWVSHFPLFLIRPASFPSTGGKKERKITTILPEIMITR